MTVSNLGVCDGHERADFLPFATLVVCGGLERTNYFHLLLWAFVVVMKELIFLSFAMLAVCGSLERIDF